MWFEHREGGVAESGLNGLRTQKWDREKGGGGGEIRIHLIHSATSGKLKLENMPALN